MKKGIIALISTIFGVGAGAVGASKIVGKSALKNQKMSEKHLAIMLLFNQWLTVKQEGKSIEEYFIKNNYKKIAIYGMSYVGERLYEELKNSNIEIKYAIDRNADSMYADIEIFKPEDQLENVDAVIVTAISFFDDIEKSLKEKLSCPIISMEDILYEI